MATAGRGVSPCTSPRCRFYPSDPRKLRLEAASRRSETLVASLPDTQREVITMLKAGGLSVEEVARATSSTVGAVKQRPHRAYARLRKLLQIQAEDSLAGGDQ
jgi:DNA-directed RNA polymerase specialized sigma24 family protein